MDALKLHGADSTA